VPAEVIHGDCLEVLRGMDAGAFDAVVTDPPYGMNYNTDSTRFTTNQNGHGDPSKRKYPRVHGDDKPFDPAPWLSFPKVILWGFHHFATRVPVGSILVWLKKADTSFGTFLGDAELAWMKGGHGVYCRRDTSLLGMTRKRCHPTQKPVGLMRWCIRRLKLRPGATILDPYMGSGTTGVAAVLEGFNFVGIEKEAAYVDIARRRIAEAEAETPLFAGVA
jgi:site-specific DNA-methyltransferase (adenine-specific)